MPPEYTETVRFGPQTGCLARGQGFLRLRSCKVVSVLSDVTRICFLLPECPKARLICLTCLLWRLTPCELIQGEPGMVAPKVIDRVSSQSNDRGRGAPKCCCAQ